VAEVRQLEAALDIAKSQGESGRSLVRRSVQTGELQDRFIGLVESSCSNQSSRFISIRIEETNEAVAGAENELVRKHRAKKQIESLMGTEQFRETAELQRRLQLELDDLARSSQSEEDANAPETSQSDHPAARPSKRASIIPQSVANLPPRSLAQHLLIEVA
jgi:hypothetical protein